MSEKKMTNPEHIIEQLEEALEERQISDRRKNNNGINPNNGSERRKTERRHTFSNISNMTRH